MRFAARLTVAMIPLTLWPPPAAGALLEHNLIPNGNHSTGGLTNQSGVTIAVAVALGVALLVLLLLTRSRNRSLRKITQAVERFGGRTPLPTASIRRGRIGMLARTLERMAEEIRDKNARLQKLAESNRLHAAVAHAIDDAVVAKSPDGTIIAWNPAAERLYGYSAAEAIGQSINLIVPPDRRQEVDDILDKAADGESLEHLETVRVNKAGKRIDVALTLAPIRADDGQVIGIAKIARDINSRKQAQQLFRLAVEASPSGIIMSDAAGRILLVNSETERMFGYTRQELIDAPVESLVPDRFRARHPEYRNAYAQKPQRRGMGAGRDLFGLRKDGREFPVEIGLNPIHTSEGLRILSVVVDITRRKAAEEKLAAQTQELQRSNADLTQFAYVASHDLREPLRTVASFTQLLAKRYQGKLDAQADQYIHYAVEGAQRMAALINDLLVYARVGTRGKEPKPTDADAVFQRVLSGMQTAIKSTDARVECAKLPMVQADEVQLGQVFQNLLGNAIKFHSDQPPHVRVSAAAHNGLWTFAVRDNGIGIDPAHAERLFQMFQRLHPRGQYEGSGIGLAVVKKIVERHGGKIWLESCPGQGATFYFTMPAADHVTSPDAAPPDHTPQPVL